MSTSALMTLGTRAMFASYAALQATSHNIANASVEGYSRQQAELQTASGQFTGAGFFGKGVDVASVTRTHDQFLTREAASSKSLAAMDQASLEQLQRLEEVFPTGEAGIGHAAGQLLNAAVDLASRPQDASTRLVVLSRAGELASRFDLAAGQLDTLQGGVTQDLQNSLASVNTLSARIADVNQQIAQLKGLGQPPNDLLDQRDQLVSTLSGFLQVTTIAADDGTLGVFIAGGQRLVLGNQATQLAVMADPMDSSRSGVGIVEASGLRSLPSNLLSGGSVAGLLKFQNEDLTDARNALGQMAAAIAGRLNEQQAFGLDARVPPGSGAPLFAVGAPVAGPAATNAKDVGGSYLASVSIRVADASLLEASDYDLQADPANAGRYLLTRNSDGLQRSIASGDTVDGFTIDVGTPAPAAADRFRLQPAGRAANGMRLALDDPRGLAAASPVTATAGVGNTGTASVGSLAVVSTSIDAGLTASIAFTSGSGDYSWTLSNGTTGTGTWTAGEPIALNGFELQLNGVPDNGDAFSVGPTAFPASNNGNALAMAALRDEPMVGRRLGLGGLPEGGQNVTDAYASVMAGVGVRVQSATSAAAISASVASTTHDQMVSKSGVNLDEEAARLIQYQQGYQAAAKVLQVAQQVFDTLLQTAAG